MKAAVYKRYGAPEVIELAEKEKPSPGDRELLIKVTASSVAAGDVRVRASDFPPFFWLPARLIFGLFRPKKQILGHEFSGIVEEVGAGVTRFKAGDAVFGTTTLLRQGAYAEYVCVPQTSKHCVLAAAPQGLDLKQAAAIPIGAMTALFLLEKAGLTRGQKILIYGASGSVGTYAVQMARHFGVEVTGVCSTSNVELVTSLGAASVIDYKKQDYTREGPVYDGVFDAVGKTSKTNAKSVLKKGGRYVSINMFTSEKTEKLEEIRALTESGALRPVIDREYPLDQIVEAHRYVDSGRKKGNVIINLNEETAL